MSLARLGTMLLLGAAIAGCDGGIYDRSDGGPVCPDCVADDASTRDAGLGPVPGEHEDACFDEVDNDLNGLSDCEEASCSADLVCCVGGASGSCCAPDGESRELSLLGCADGPAATCLASRADLLLFGGELPTVEDAALVPQGGTGHGGVALGEPLDLRAANVTFTATVEVPEPAMRCTECVDGAGIAVLPDLPASDQRAAVRFGVLATSSRDEVVVLVADEVVARAPLPVGSALLAIDVGVDGTAVARLGEVELARVEGLELPESAWLAVFGQSTNPSAGVERVRVRDARVTTYACDAPAAVVRRSAPVVPWSGATGWSPREVRHPSVATYTQAGSARAMMAFAHAGAIHLAQRTGAGEFRHASGDPGPPALPAPDGVASLSDPSLIADVDRFVLYFVGLGADGATRMWKTTGDPDFAQTFGAPAMVLDPVEFGLLGIDGVHVTPSGSGWALLARVDTGQDRRIVRFASADGLAWELHGGSLDAATLRMPRTDDLFAFDRDEVAGPALVTFPDARGNDVTRIYYAGRRGTRWSIGMLASLDGVRFRAVGAVLGPGEGFDALGVTDPDPVVEAGVLRVYYTGTDGASYRIGASGPAGTLGE